ncbi:hypothetical protein BGZ92_005695 [Podila epicladia]|nr:hypothetical protein BGZ92_005695 [Podila epicladia]
MTEERLSLFCLVDGLPSSRASPIKATFTDTAHQTPAFFDITPDQLNLWRVSIPYDKQGSDTTIGALDDKTELNNPRTRLSKLFPESPDDNTYIIVQRPPQGDLRADIKEITDKFFAPGTPITDFLDAYVRGEMKLPITTAG